MVKHLPTMWETRVQSLSREDPLEKEMATHSNIQPGKSHGWRSLVGYSPWGCKESDTTSDFSKKQHFSPREVCGPAEETNTQEITTQSKNATGGVSTGWGGAQRLGWDEGTRPSETMERRVFQKEETVCEEPESSCCCCC